MECNENIHTIMSYNTDTLKLTVNEVIFNKKAVLSIISIYTPLQQEFCLKLDLSFLSSFIWVKGWYELGHRRAPYAPDVRRPTVINVRCLIVKSNLIAIQYKTEH